MVGGVTTREHVTGGVLRKEFGKCSAWRFVNAAGIAAARATGGVEVPVAASGSDQGKKDGVFVRGRQQEVPVGSEPQARLPRCGGPQPFPRCWCRYLYRCVLWAKGVHRAPGVITPELMLSGFPSQGV